MAAESPLRAILCEDDPQLLRAMATIAELYGFSDLAVAGSASDALEVAEAKQPHVVLLDVAVTGLSGLGLVRAIRQLLPSCAVVVVAPFPALRAAARAAGADDLIDPTDLRPLGPVLARARQRAHAGVACDCCSSSNTAGVTLLSAPPGSPGSGATSKGEGPTASNSIALGPGTLPPASWGRRP